MNYALKLIDGKEPLSRENVLEAFAKTPFIVHQYRWFLQKVAADTPVEGIRDLQGYVNVKNMTPLRTARLLEIHGLLQEMNASGDLSHLPSRGDALLLPVTFSGTASVGARRL